MLHLKGAPSINTGCFECGLVTFVLKSNRGSCKPPRKPSSDEGRDAVTNVRRARSVQGRWKVCSVGRVGRHANNRFLTNHMLRCCTVITFTKAYEIRTIHLLTTVHLRRHRMELVNKPSRNDGDGLI